MPNKILKTSWRLDNPKQEVYDYLGAIKYRNLYRHCHKAFLYGSRSKLNEDKVSDSDWDIAVPSSGLFAEELSLEGWTQKPLDPSDYRDDYTTHIFEKTFPLGAKVQIAFKSDYDSFKTVWTHLPVSLYEALMWKKSPTYVGRDEICHIINELKRVYDLGTLRGKYPSSEDKYLEEVERQRTEEHRARGGLGADPWGVAEMQPVAVAGGGEIVREVEVVAAQGGGGGGAFVAQPGRFVFNAAEF